MDEFMGNSGDEMRPSKFFFLVYCDSNFDIKKWDVTEVAPHNNDIHSKIIYLFLESVERSLLVTVVSFKLHCHII